MTITLTSEIENAISERAQREGTTLEHFAIDGLTLLIAAATATAGCHS